MGARCAVGGQLQVEAHISLEGGGTCSVTIASDSDALEPVDPISEVTVPFDEYLTGTAVFQLVARESSDAPVTVTVTAIAGPARQAAQFSVEVMPPPDKPLPEIR